MPFGAMTLINRGNIRRAATGTNEPCNVRYRARNLLERFFSKIKQRRRVATRNDKLAANDLAFIQLASIRIWLRVNRVRA